MQDALKPEHAQVPGDPSRGARCLSRRARGDLRPGLLTEYLTEDTGFFVRSAREFERFRSPFQTVEVHERRRSARCSGSTATS